MNTGRAPVPPGRGHFVNSQDLAKASGVRHERIVAVVTGYAPAFRRTHVAPHGAGGFALSAAAVDRLGQTFERVAAARLLAARQAGNA